MRTRNLSNTEHKNMSKTIASVADYSTMDLINNHSKYESKLLKEKKERRASALDHFRETGTMKLRQNSGFNTNIDSRIPL